ncbi:MAG: hypothetical protein U1F36_03485 [Planctomycetota bacterium]
MNLRTLSALCVISGLLPLQGSGPTPTPSAPESHPDLAKAWLIEHLDRDVARARAAYDEASGTEPSEDLRLFALACRAEIDLIRGDTAEVDAALQRLRRVAGRLPPLQNSIDLPREELAQALAMPDGVGREAALARARDSFRDRFESTDRDRVGTIRNLLPSIAWFGERGRNQREIPRTGSGSMAAWRAYAIRALADERFESAERLALRLRGPGGSATSSADPTALRRSGRLGEDELQALDALDRAIDSWRQRGDEALVVRALAALPY